MNPTTSEGLESFRQQLPKHYEASQPQIHFLNMVLLFRERLRGLVNYREQMPSNIDWNSIEKHVRKQWIGQGIWRPEWDTASSDRVSFPPSGARWKHQDPVLSARELNQPQMSQPISQFFSEMMAERAWLLGQVNFLLPVAADARKKLGRIMLERYPLHVVTNDNKIPEALKNKAPSKSEPFNDIYSQAYFAVKARWNQWNIWEREWGVLPGTAWPSDFPYAEYERLKIGLFKAVDSDVQEDSVQGADDNGFPPRYLPEPELATNASDGPASSHNEGQDDILKTIFADTEKYLRTTIDDSVTDLGGLFGSGRPDFPTRVNEPDTITVGLFGNKTNLPAKDNKAGTHTDGLFGDVKTNLWTYVGPVDTIAGGFFGSKKNPQTQGGQKNTPARGLFGNGNDDVPKAGHQTVYFGTKPPGLFDNTILWPPVRQADQKLGSLFGNKTNLQTRVGQKSTHAGGLFGNAPNKILETSQAKARSLFRNDDDDVPKADRQTAYFVTKPTSLFGNDRLGPSEKKTMSNYEYVFIGNRPVGLRKVNGEGIVGGSQPQKKASPPPQTDEKKPRGGFFGNLQPTVVEEDPFRLPKMPGLFSTGIRGTAAPQAETQTEKQQDKHEEQVEETGEQGDKPRGLFGAAPSGTLFGEPLAPTQGDKKRKDTTTEHPMLLRNSKRSQLLPPTPFAFGSGGGF